MSFVQHASTDFIDTVLIARAYRFCWQHPRGSTLDLCVVVWLAKISNNTLSHLGSWLILATFARTGAQNMWGNLWFMVTMLVTAWVCTTHTHTQHRNLWNWCRSHLILQNNSKLKFANMSVVYIVLLACMPLTIGVVIAASALSAPLLPLLGIPLFLVGCPRPQRQWPTSGN